MYLIKKNVFLLFLLFSTFFTFSQQSTIFPGKMIQDANGNALNAHGAGLLYWNNKFYLYGEIKSGNTWLVPEQGWECYRVPAKGISSYSSSDLVSWKYEGVVLPSTSGRPPFDLDTGNVIERPKVLFNPTTKKFVMWFHVDSKTYSYARAGVAVSDSPTGPFQYLYSINPNGNSSRDLTVFQDEDHQAYLVYASEENKTMHICKLTEDYLLPSPNYKRILVNEYREAPALFKHNGKYYMITSGVTGWSPNKALYAVSDDLLGDWKLMENPCKGKNAELTFLSQSTYVLPIPRKKNNYLFFADRWNKTDLAASTYVWLPLTIKNEKPVIKWRKKWRLKLNWEPDTQ